MTFFNKKTKDASSSYSCSGGSSCGVSVASSEQTSPTIRSEVGRLADAFIMYVDIRDRRYRARVWRDCFIGSEAVDALIYAGLADNRENAVLVGRHLQKELRLFAHVCDDHDFKDDFLFYRMKKTKMSFEELPIQHFSNLEQKAKLFYQISDVQDRTYRLKKYRSVFVASEVIDSMVYHGLARTRWEAVQLGRAMAKHLNLFQHVTKHYAFADNFLFFQFSAGALKVIEKLDTTPKVITLDALDPTSVATSLASSDDTSIDRSTVTSAVEKESLSTAIDLDVFRKKPKKKTFSYPEPLPELTEVEFDEDCSKSSNASPFAPTFTKPTNDFGKKALILNKITNRLQYTCQKEQLEQWHYVVKELKSKLASRYIGHHVVVEQPILARKASTVPVPQPKKDDNDMQPKRQAVPMVMAPFDLQMDLSQNFATFDSIVRNNDTLSTDMDSSVWTEFIVEDNRPTEEQNEDEFSYMEFTVLEEETVHASYVEEPVVELNQHSPGTIVSPWANPESPQCHQLPPSPEEEQFPTITVDSLYDDDMTQITMDHYFSNNVKLTNTIGGQLPTHCNTSPTVCSQDSVGSTKQEINNILRKQLWSGDEDVVCGALEIVCCEVVLDAKSRAYIVQCGGVMAVFKTMEANPNNENIQYLACTILKELASESETKSVINDLDGIPTVVQSMQLHPSSVRVSEAARGALAAFCM